MPEGTLILRVVVEGKKKDYIGICKEEYRRTTDPSKNVLVQELLEIGKRFEIITRIEFVAEAPKEEPIPFDPEKQEKLEKLQKVPYEQNI